MERIIVKFDACIKLAGCVHERSGARHRQLPQGA